MYTTFPLQNIILTLRPKYGLSFHWNNGGNIPDKETNETQKHVKWANNWRSSEIFNLKKKKKYLVTCQDHTADRKQLGFKPGLRDTIDIE